MRQDQGDPNTVCVPLLGEMQLLPPVTLIQGNQMKEQMETGFRAKFPPSALGAHLGPASQVLESHVYTTTHEVTQDTEKPQIPFFFFSPQC